MAHLFSKIYILKITLTFICHNQCNDRETNIRTVLGTCAEFETDSREITSSSTKKYKFALMKI